jgi:hypothetical protein
MSDTNSKHHPKMFYFGPWDEPGHYLFHEGGLSVFRREGLGDFPWHEHGRDIDGELQPKERAQGVALLHHKDGWTALSFWDQSVDTRPGSNSNYFAEGTFTFEEMVEMARTRFAERWNKMNFTVRPAQPDAHV